jgi:hypothetical protein
VAAILGVSERTAYRMLERHALAHTGDPQQSPDGTPEA